MPSQPSPSEITGVLETRTPQAPLELKDRALAATAEGITIADATLPGNPLIYVNAGFERLTGFTAAEVLGRNCNFLQGPGTAEEARQTLRTAIANRVAITVQLLNYRKDGSPFWNRLSITPVSDATGAVTHFIGVQSDVTSEFEAKQQLQLANQRLEAASQAIQEDLHLAAEVQRSLILSKLPAVPGFGFAFRFRPCNDVGGDCLDVFPLDGHHTGLYILDVSGHGVASALFAVSLSHMLSSAPERSFLFQPHPEARGAYTIAPPAKVVERLNRHFIERGRTGQYFTMIYGVLNNETGEFRYAAAGQLGPAYAAAGQPARILETGGMPVSLIPGAVYQEHAQRLAPGDRIYLFTDGILEAANREKREFGVERFLASLDLHRGQPVEDVLSALFGEVERWSAPAGPADDASLLAFERIA
jgi:PAS domain S-box-containing protein